MKTLFLLIMIFLLFLFIFVESNVWEVRHLKENRNGIEYLLTKHSMHWDRFFDYIKGIPEKAMFWLKTKL